MTAMLGSFLEPGKCSGISLTWVNPVRVRQLKNEPGDGWCASKRWEGGS